MEGHWSCRRRSPFSGRRSSCPTEGCIYSTPTTMPLLSPFHLCSQWAISIQRLPRVDPFGSVAIFPCRHSCPKTSQCATLRCTQLIYRGSGSESVLRRCHSSSSLPRNRRTLVLLCYKFGS